MTSMRLGACSHSPPLPVSRNYLATTPNGRRRVQRVCRHTRRSPSAHLWRVQARRWQARARAKKHQRHGPCPDLLLSSKAGRDHTGRASCGTGSGRTSCGGLRRWWLQTDSLVRSFRLFFHCRLQRRESRVRLYTRRFFAHCGLFPLSRCHCLCHTLGRLFPLRLCFGG